MFMIIKYHKILLFTVYDGNVLNIYSNELCSMLPNDLKYACGDCMHILFFFTKLHVIIIQTKQLSSIIFTRYYRKQFVEYVESMIAQQ